MMHALTTANLVPKPKVVQCTTKTAKFVDCDDERLKGGMIRMRIVDNYLRERLLKRREGQE